MIQNLLIALDLWVQFWVSLDAIVVVIETSAGSSDKPELNEDDAEPSNVLSEGTHEINVNKAVNTS